MRFFLLLTPFPYLFQKNWHLSLQGGEILLNLSAETEQRLCSILSKKVLLKLSSKIKFSQSLNAVKMIAMAPHQLVCIAIIGSTHILLVWVAIALSTAKAMREARF